MEVENSKKMEYISDTIIIGDSLCRDYLGANDRIMSKLDALCGTCLYDVMADVYAYVCRTYPGMHENTARIIANKIIVELVECIEENVKEGYDFADYCRVKGR